MEVATEFAPLTEAWNPIRSALEESHFAWKGVSLAALGTVAMHFEVDCEPFKRSTEGQCQWETSRWVGSFAYAGQSWRIEPRIGWPRLQAMIGEVFSVGVHPGGGVSHDDESNLVGLAWLLAFDSAWRRHRGAAKAFVRHEVDDAPSLRGQLGLSAQLSKLVDRHQFSCRYDNLTYDNPINSGALLAIKALKQRGRFPFNGPGNHLRIVREWQEALWANGVETPAHFPANSVRWSRANDGFRAAHWLAQWVVGEQQATAGAARGASAFLFDSAEVWELYLYKQLKDALCELSDRFPGYSVDWPRDHLGEADALLEWQGQRHLSQIPDLRVLRPDGDGTTVALVIDAKYRRYRPPTDDAEVALQMFRYAASAQRRKGESWPPTVLLYPSCPESKGSAAGGVRGLNPQNGDGPYLLGCGRFLVPGGSALRAWGVKLPDGDGMHQTVRTQLCHILQKSLV